MYQITRLPAKDVKAGQSLNFAKSIFQVDNAIREGKMVRLYGVNTWGDKLGQPHWLEFHENQPVTVIVS